MLCSRFIGSVLFAFAAVAAFDFARAGEVKVPEVAKFPSGEASLGDPLLWGGRVPNTSDGPYLYVGDVFRYYLDGSNGLTNRVDFGGTSFADRRWVSPYTPQDLTVDVLNGAVFHATALTSSRGIEGSKHTILVHDGGVFDCGNFQVTKDDSRIRIYDNGYLVTTNTATYFGSTTKGDVLYSSFSMNDSTWDSQSTLWLGRKDNWEDIHFSFGVTNSLIDFRSGIIFNDDSDFVFSNVVLRVDGSCAIDSGSHVWFYDVDARDAETRKHGVWTFGARAANRDQELHLLGITRLQLIGMSVGHNASRTGRVVVAGNSDLDFTLPAFSYDNTCFGISGAAYLEIRDSGRFHSSSSVAGGVPVRFGVNAGSFGQMDLFGGTYEYYNYGTWFGISGSGVCNVHGGTLRANRLDFGTSDSETENAVLRQTGGLIRLMTADGQIAAESGRIYLASAKHPSEAHFEGGVAEIGFLRSSNPAYAKVVANGGTLRRVAAAWSGTVADKKFISAIGDFRVGSKGLTIDSNGTDIEVDQSMTNVTGEEGELVKTGRGTMTFSSASYDVSRTTVRQGVLKVGNASGDLQTDLAVTNGAEFSLVGTATGVTLTGLTVDNATISLDPGDKITVTGPLSVNRLKINFSILPTVDQLEDFIVADGELSDATLQAFRRAIVSNTLADGTHGALTVSYDPGTLKTTVKIGVRTNEPLTESTQWNGTDGNWGADGNWSDGQPSATKVAAFTDDAAGTAVSVPAGAVVRAFAFEGQDYVLSGSSVLSMPAEEGSAVITATACTNRLDVPISADSTVNVELGVGGSVELAQPVDGGGIRKSGKGLLTLSADNAFLRPLTLLGGTTVAATAGALGTSADSDNTVNLGDATLLIPEGDGSAFSLAQDFVIKTTDAKNTTIVRNERDVTFENGIRPDTGVFLKRGKGTLTIKVADGDILSNSDGNGNFGADAAQISFPEDGTPTNRLCAAYTVVEGPLVFKPREAGTHPAVTLKNTAVCGIKVPKVSDVQPEFALEDISMDMSLHNFWLGHGCNAANELSYPVLCLVNSSLTLSTLQIGCWGYAANGGPTLAATNATISAAALNLTTSNGNNSPVRLRIKDSTLVVRSASNPIKINGAMDAEFDNSILGWEDGTSHTMTGGGQYTGTQTWRFANGSTLCVGAFSSLLGNNYSRTFVFDDSTWNVGANDLTLDSTVTAVDKFSVVASAGVGIRLRIASGNTLSFAEVPLTGDGGLVMEGAGTVSFGEGMYQAAGKIVPQTGLIDFIDAGTLGVLTIGQGAGTIKGLAATKITLEVEVDDDGNVIGDVPVFDGGSVAKAYVSFGRDAGHALEKLPENALIARYTGDVPPAINWRKALDIGEGKASLVVTAANGEIRATAVRTGALILVR